VTRSTNSQRQSPQSPLSVLLGEIANDVSVSEVLSPLFLGMERKLRHWQQIQFRAIKNKIFGDLSMFELRLRYGYFYRTECAQTLHINTVLNLFVNFAPNTLIHEQNWIEMMKSYICRALCWDCDPYSDWQSTCTELMIIYNFRYFWAENFCLLLNALFRFPVIRRGLDRNSTANWWMSGTLKDRMKSLW